MEHAPKPDTLLALILAEKDAVSKLEAKLSEQPEFREYLERKAFLRTLRKRRDEFELKPVARKVSKVGPEEPTMADEINRVLVEAGKSLTAPEIAKAMMANGYEFGAKTPADILVRAALKRAQDRMGFESRKRGFKIYWRKRAANTAQEETV